MGCLIKSNPSRIRDNFFIGEEVWQIEKNLLLPNGSYMWSAIITHIEANYIETSFVRDTNLVWLNDLVKSLSPSHLTYSRIFVKNYYSVIDDSINIKKKTIYDTIN